MAISGSIYSITLKRKIVGRSLCNRCSRLQYSQLDSSFPLSVHRYSATQAVCCRWRREETSPTPKAVIKYILLQDTACQVSKNTPPEFLVIGSMSVQATVLMVIDRWRCICGNRTLLLDRVNLEILSYTPSYQRLQCNVLISKIVWVDICVLLRYCSVLC
jgi:hypothetical protein